MMQDMRKWCCGPGGRPDFDRMTTFIDRHERSSKFDAIGWGLFFVWVGLAWLADLGMAVGSLGVAAITLGMQGVRKLAGLRVEGFWIVVGFAFAIAGLWHWIDIQKPLAPFILIAVGMVLLIWQIWPGSRNRGS